MKYLDPKQLKRQIRFTPHPGQREVLKKMKRFTVLCCGRRWGKSLLASYLCLKEGLLSNRVVWYVAPTYDLASKGFSILTKWIATYFPVGAFKVNYSTLTIDCPHGSKIVCKSTENLDSLLGEGVHFVVLDELARTKKEAWEYIRPALSDTEGKAIFISTPFGKNNHFFPLFTRGRSGDPNWISFTFSSLSNPHLSKEDLEEARQNLPEQVWNQEYLAQFLDSTYQVFRGVKDIVDPGLPQKQRGKVYFGLDLAQSQDFTCLIGMDSGTNSMIFFDRFSKIYYTQQKLRILEVVKKYYPFQIVVDTGAAGGSIVDDLRGELGLAAVMDFSFTGSISKDIKKAGTKQRAVEKLAQMIESKDISIFDEPILIDELEQFGIELTAKGHISYSAPSGSHDDSVCALAMACWPLENIEKKKITEKRKRETEARAREVRSRPHWQQYQ